MLCSQGSLYTSPNLNRYGAPPSPLPPSFYSFSPFSLFPFPLPPSSLFLPLPSFSLPLPSFSLPLLFSSLPDLSPSPQIFGSCEAHRLDEWQPSVTPPIEEEAVSKVSKLQLHTDNPPDTPPDCHGDPILTASGGEQTASETQIEGLEGTPQQSLCCEKRSPAGHRDDDLLPSQRESKTVADSSRAEVSLEMLESRRDPSLELQLKKLFDSAKSLTAKENLLLSLRYCPHLPSPLPLTPTAPTSPHPPSPLLLTPTPPSPSLPPLFLIPTAPTPPHPHCPHSSSDGKRRVGSIGTRLKSTSSSLHLFTLLSVFVGTSFYLR